MGRGLPLVLLGAAAWGLLAITSSSGALQSRASQTVRGSILVASNQGLYRRYPDGRLKQLTTNSNDRFPAWSKDGRQVAFERLDPPRLGCPLFVMRSDGTGAHQVGDVMTDCSGAGWDPAGRRLVFGGAPPGANGATLWVVNADGTGLRRLFRGRGANAEGTHPAWSPNGRTIVFGWTATPSGLLAIRPNGSGLHALVKPPPRSGRTFVQPSWSRDGTRLAFVQVELTSNTRKIVVATAGGRKRRVLARLPLNSAEQGAPSWSPNGSRVAFSGGCGKQICVWTIPSRGGRRQVLMRGLFFHASWGPGSS